MKGFVKTELLEGEALTKETASARMRAARDAKDLAVAVRWAERAAAIDPDDRALLEAVRDVRKAAGLKSGPIEEGLAGKAPVYLALCRSTRVEVVALVKADGMPEPGKICFLIKSTDFRALS